VDKCDRGLARRLVDQQSVHVRLHASRSDLERRAQWRASRHLLGRGILATVVDGRAALPSELALLVGEPETLSYDELRHTFARLIHGENGETLDAPGALAPLAKAGAWMMEKLPGGDRFVRP
jgi:hypothetical protein